MTDKEIIKALECCIKPTSDCEKCPYFKKEECFDIAKRDALNLIVCQQAEIENYSNNTKTMSDSIYKMQKLIEGQQAEIERLKHEREVLIEDIHHSADQINEQIEEIERLTINMNAFGLGMKQEKERADTIRAEAIKEFIEKLKDLSYDSDLYDRNGRWVKAVTVEEIDETYKEMMGDDK